MYDILIWRRSCDVTERWDVANSQGRYFSIFAITDKTISWLLLGFTGTVAHQSKGNLTPCPAGTSTISCNKTVPEFEGFKKWGWNMILILKKSLIRLQQKVITWLLLWFTGAIANQLQGNLALHPTGLLIKYLSSN